MSQQTACLKCVNYIILHIYKNKTYVMFNKHIVNIFLIYYKNYGKYQTTWGVKFMPPSFTSGIGEILIVCSFLGKVELDIYLKFSKMLSP